MANGHGGMRRPNNPAPVSGPGRLSQRTDGGPQQTQARMSGMPYGENADFMDIQSSAPMAAAPSVPTTRMRNESPTGNGAAATPLFAPTGRPDEPITAGSQVGPGEGPVNTNPGMTATNRSDAQMLGRYLPDLLRSAQAPNAPEGFIRFVRHLRNMQGGM